MSGNKSGRRLISDIFSVTSLRDVEISAKLSFWAEKSSIVVMGDDNFDMLFV
jgi:hypothetical protein